MALMLLALSGALAFHAIASLPRVIAWLMEMLVTAATLTLPLATAAALLLIGTIFPDDAAPLSLLCASLAALVVAIGASHRGGVGARDGSMRRLEAVNIGLGTVIVVTCLALASPLADLLRLAPAAQVARLELGHAEVGLFDFASLAADGTRFGSAALSKLQQSLYPDIARAAFAAAPAAARNDGTEVGRNIALHTPGGQLPATLLARDGSPVLGVPVCLSNPQLTCDAWFHDLNGDGRQEILLASGSETRWWAAARPCPTFGTGALTSFPPCPAGTSWWWWATRSLRPPQSRPARITEV